jgi:hypothetical protein
MPTWQIHKCKEESRKKQIGKSTGNCAANCKSETTKGQEPEVLIKQTKSRFSSDWMKPFVKVLTTRKRF